MKEEIRRLYYSNGQLKYEVSCKNGKVRGIIKSFKLNGQIYIQDSWKHNQQHGILIVFKY